MQTSQGSHPLHYHHSHPTSYGYGSTVSRSMGSWSASYVFFVILNSILMLAGLGLAGVAFYTMTLDKPSEDLRTEEYQYHTRQLMFAIGLGGCLALMSGFAGVVIVNPHVHRPVMRVLYELMLLVTGALLSVLGALALGAVLMRKNVIENHYRPLMSKYEHETPPNPFLDLHHFQGYYSCCGLSQPPDPYMHLKAAPLGPLPWSCCANYTNAELVDVKKLNETIANARSKNCTKGGAETHKEFCDKITPSLSQWSLACGLAALAVSWYCIFLLVIACIARKVGSDAYDSD